MRDLLEQHAAGEGPASIFKEARVTWGQLSHTETLHANTQCEK